MKQSLSKKSHLKAGRSKPDDEAIAKPIFTALRVKDIHSSPDSDSNHFRVSRHPDLFNFEQIALLLFLNLSDSPRNANDPGVVPCFLRSRTSG